MIELNNKTRQDFLDREWCKRFVDAGVDMSDAKYFITNIDNKDWVCYNETAHVDCESIPTYSFAELLYKLHEWPYDVNIKSTDTTGNGNSEGLSFFKDAPFYFFYYRNWPETQEAGESEYPIYSAASLLLWCMKNGIGCVDDVSDK